MSITITLTNEQTQSVLSQLSVALRTDKFVTCNILPKPKKEKAKIRRTAKPEVNVREAVAALIEKMEKGHEFTPKSLRQAIGNAKSFSIAVALNFLKKKALVERVKHSVWRRI